MVESGSIEVDNDLQFVELRNRPDWIAVLAGWHQQQWPDKGTFANRVASFAGHLASTPVPLTLVLSQAGQPIGNISLIRYQSSSKAGRHSSYWVANVFVTRSHRGCGHGRRLLVAIERRARQLQIPQLYLHSSDKWRFYRHVGWVVCEERVVAGESSRIMRRDL